MTDLPTDAAAHFADLVQRRRTSLLVDLDRPVPDDLVGQLIEASTWAPNHKRTWPWRFTVLTGEARSRFGEVLAADAAEAGLPEKKVDKLRTKYLRSPTLVLVWVAPDESGDPARAREDRDATAAAVQNLLLAATAHGLSSYWGSLPDALVPAARRATGESGDPVAVVYLGWPSGEVATPARPTPEVTWLT